MTTKSLGGSPRGGEGEPASTSTSRGAWDVQGSPRPGSPYRKRNIIRLQPVEGIRRAFSDIPRPKERSLPDWGDPIRSGYGLRYYLFILVLFTVLVLVGTVGAWR